MKERIIELIEYYGLSSSQFAAEIGIQRSAMSHILSGRNKPSLDFVLKVLDRFSEIDTEWLLFGKGQMLRNKNAKENIVTEDLFSKDEDNKGISENKKVENEEKVDLLADMNQKKSSGTEVTEDVRSIDKIVFFYKNGKFKVYEP
jgi:transcriptional regulator with XRE-family HTH domain